MEDLPFVGLDVAKNNFKVHLLADVLDANKKLRGTFPRTRHGFAGLCAWIKQHGFEKAWICMEHTGPYWKPIADYMFREGHQISVIRADKAHYHAKSGESRNKTDDQDAFNLATFVREKKPRLWQPAAVEDEELRELHRRRDQLVKEQTRETNRLEYEPLTQTVFDSIHDHLKFLEQQISSINTAIKSHMNSHPRQKEIKALYASIPGIGEITANALTAEISDCSAFPSYKAVHAFVGLDLTKQESGTSLRKPDKISRKGNKSLRQKLYMAAMAAVRTDAHFRQFNERLKAKGKKHKVRMVAVMCKLLKTAYAVVKSRPPFVADFPNRCVTQENTA